MTSSGANTPFAVFGNNQSAVSDSKLQPKEDNAQLKLETDMHEEGSNTNATTTMELDENNLYVKGLRKECTQVELDDLFKQFGVITQSRVYGDGVGFVRFETPEAAKLAIETMHNKRSDPRSHEPLVVKYAYRKVRNNKRVIRVGKDDVEMIMNKNTNNVYLRCLPQHFAEKDLHELCSPYGELTCTRVRENGVAFVRFRQPEDAQHAIRELNGKVITGSQKPLLAKLANSDPFQPKIGFRARNGEDCDEVRVIEDESMAAALLAQIQAQKTHENGTNNKANEIVEIFSSELWNSITNGNRSKTHNRNHKDANGNKHSSGGRRHKKKNRRNNANKNDNKNVNHNQGNNNINNNNSNNNNNTNNNNNNSNNNNNNSNNSNNNINNINNGTNNNSINSTNNSTNNSINRLKGYDHINGINVRANSGVPSTRDHGKYPSNLSSLTLGNAGTTASLHPHLIATTELLQPPPSYGGMPDPVPMFSYQTPTGYPYYTTGTPNATTASPATNVFNTACYTGIGVNFPYAQTPSSNTQNTSNELINGAYNVLQLGLAPQSATSKQSLSDSDFGQFPLTAHMDNLLGEPMGTPRDMLPLQGQISESITPHNPLMLENGTLMFSSQTVSQNNFNGIKSDDLKAVLSTPQEKSLLKDRVHGGGQNVTTVSNTPLPISVAKLGVPGLTVTSFGPPQPLFFSPGGASEYSSVLSTGSTPYVNVAPSTNPGGKLPMMATFNSNTPSKMQQFLSPSSRQLLDLQSQLSQSPKNVSWQATNVSPGSLSTPGGPIKLFDPTTTMGSSSGVIGRNNSNNGSSTTDSNWAVNAPLQMLQQQLNSTNANPVILPTTSNTGDIKIGDNLFATAYQRYPKEVKRNAGPSYPSNNYQTDFLRMSENTSELKDQFATALNLREPQQ